MRELNEIIDRLYRLGHFHNPAHPTGVKEVDLPKLKLTDASVKIAIQSYQEFMAGDFDKFSLEEHDRIGIADGEIGPATAKLLAMDRCECPDYALETIEAANGRGSWPVGCHKDLFPANHAFAVWFDRPKMPSHWRTIFDEAWGLVRAAYANIGMAFFEVLDRAKANTTVTWERSRSWIGLAIVPRNPSCGDRISAKFDNAYGSTMQRMQMVWQIARLMAHEFCHNMGLSHTRGGIMNPSIVGGPFTTTAWRGDPSEPALVRLFGGVPVNIGGPKPDPKPPTDSVPPLDAAGLYFDGSFTLRQGDKSLGDFILVPKPKV
jgi:hypothetical protein